MVQGTDSEPDLIPPLQMAPSAADLPDLFRDPSVASDTLRLQRDRFRLKAIEANGALPDLVVADDHQGAEDRFANWRQVDPFPHIAPALLNAADIADYIRATGMIHPFDPKHLKPASLEIHLQGEYLFYDSSGELKQGFLLPLDHPEFASKKAQTELTVPGNSIVFVTVEPLFQMPDYIAMRFNLKIDHVYKGLLLGTGPLVDPGFSGSLHIPLHNLTQEDYTFQVGAGLIWAEFTKLSPHALFSEGAPRTARQVGHYPPLKEKAPGGDRTILDYIAEGTGNGARPRSSLPAAVEEAKRAAKGAADVTETVDKLDKGLRNLRVGAVIATIIATATVLLPTYNLVSDANRDSRSTNAQLIEQQHQIQDLKAKIAQLDASLAKTQQQITGKAP